MLPLDRPLLDEISLGAAGGAALSLILGVAAHLRLRRLARGYATVDAAGGTGTVMDAVAGSVRETQALRGEVAQARTDLDAARRDLADALRHVAVVRYDAFGDMGGRLSFTAALLDDAGDGLLLTSINGRSEARSYAKGVKSGRSDVSLSPEEQQAIELAMRAPGRG